MIPSIGQMKPQLSSGDPLADPASNVASFPYIYLCQEEGTTVYKSSDLGANIVATSLGTGYCWDLSCSGDGQYVHASCVPLDYYTQPWTLARRSADYGSTVAQTTITNKLMQFSAMSHDGAYRYLSHWDSGGAKSSNYGVSFTYSSLSNIRVLDSSNTGQYAYGYQNNLTFLLQGTDNYGASWGGRIVNGSSGSIQDVQCSKDGSLVYVILNNVLYKSTTYGASNSFTSVTNHGLATTLYNVRISAGGRYIIVYRYGNGLYVPRISRDYGATWSNMSVNMKVKDIQISGSGKYIVITPWDGVQYIKYSDDYGVTINNGHYVSQQYYDWICAVPRG